MPADERDLRHSASTDDTANLPGKIFRNCRSESGPLTTIPPDFLVAAHARTHADALATEGRGDLRACFPSIRTLPPTRRPDSDTHGAKSGTRPNDLAQHGAWDVTKPDRTR